MVVVIQRRELSKKEKTMVTKTLLNPFHTLLRLKGTKFFFSDENDIKKWLMMKYGKGYYYIYAFGGNPPLKRFFLGQV